jgi:exodeoxyribonuclease V alpha subunit
MPETITGQVRELAIKVESTSWGVARVALGSDDRTSEVTGTILGIAIGDTIEATGAWRENQRWGRQFVATTIRVIVPRDADGFVGWLARRLPNVGRKRATDIVRHFGGPDGAHAALLDGSRLAEVDGITPERARAISEAYRAIETEREKMQAFVSYKLTDGQIAKIESVWGDEALDRLRQNPFALIEHVPGFGFKRANEIAERMGLPHDHPARIVAGLLHVLEQAEIDGHTFVPSGYLVKEGAKLLDLDRDVVAPHLASVVDGRRAVARGKWVFRVDMDRAEGNVARRLVRMLTRRAAA